MTKKQFESLLKDKLGKDYRKALSVFNKYDDGFSWDVAFILLHASDKGKVDEALVSLKNSWKKNPEDHEAYKKSVRDSEIRTAFLDICQNVLSI